MITDTPNCPAGCRHHTKSCSHPHTHTPRASLYPWGSAVASVAAWCSISRTTHYYSDTLVLWCSNVLSILLNLLYLAPEGKQFMKPHLCYEEMKWTQDEPNPRSDFFFYFHMMWSLKYALGLVSIFRDYFLALSPQCQLFLRLYWCENTSVVILRVYSTTSGVMLGNVRGENAHLHKCGGSSSERWTVKGEGRVRTWLFLILGQEQSAASPGFSLRCLVSVVWKCRHRVAPFFFLCYFVTFNGWERSNRVYCEFSLGSCSEIYLTCLLFHWRTFVLTTCTGRPVEDVGSVYFGCAVTVKVPYGTFVFLVNKYKCTRD